MTEVYGDDDLQRLLTELPGWKGDVESLQRSVEFSDFPAAIRAVVAVAEVAETMNHHPDIDIRWRTVTFTVATHSAGGVTAADLELAHRISGIVGP